MALALACWLPSAAAAAPMPPGTYDVTIQNGTLDIGAGLLPPIPLESGTTFALTLGSDPKSAPVGLTLLSTQFSHTESQYSVSGTVDVTVLGAGATIDPATAEVTLDASFYGTLTASGTVTVPGVGSLPVSGDCTFGSPAQPIDVHFSSTQGTPWDPVTGAMSLVDNSFALTYSCPGLLGTAISFLVGDTGAGHNIATIAGSVIRRPDPVVTNPTTTPEPATTPVVEATPPPANPNEVTPVTTPTAKACVVPKLVGKTLKQAKRALTKAGCKVGKAKKKNSKKRKKGRIVKQRYKAGTKLPAGTKVPITVSKGQKKARKR